MNESGSGDALDGVILKRWPIIIAALFIQICLGAIYCWGVFLTPVMSSFGVNKTKVSLSFSSALVFYTLSMIFGGKWQDKFGPRRVVITAGLLLGLGYVLAGLAPTIELFYLTYGVLGGTGIGLGYICPLAVCAKWFPDKKGMAIGLAVAGFGAGSLIFAPVSSFLIAILDWRVTFIILGLLFAIVILVAGMFMKNPPDFWHEKFQPLVAATGATEKAINWKKMIKTKLFWYLWVMFVLMGSAGLMFIGHLPDFLLGLELPRETGPVLLGVLSICNGGGRIILGSLSDRYGRGNILFLTSLLFGLVLFLMLKVTTFLLLFILCMIAGLAFGGTIAMFPTITSEQFGSENLGMNYGLLFTAYGIGGVIGPTLGAIAYDRWQNYSTAFFIMGNFCLVALIFVLKIKPLLRVKKL